MRRYPVKLTAFFIYSLFLLMVLCLNKAHGASDSMKLEALSLPAPPTSRGENAAMLSITKAGTRFVAVGERGIVLLSDNEGQAWRQAKVPVSVTLTAVQFVDEKLGWVAGHLGVVLHTKDGGENWSLQLDGVTAANLALADAKSVASGSATDIAKRVAFAKTLVEDGPDKPFLDLHFQNATRGYVIGAYNLVYRTDDGGQSWRPWMNHVDNPKGLHLYGIRAIGDVIYIVGEQGLLLRSANVEGKFEAVKSPSKGTFFGAAATAEHLLVYGLRGRVFLSENAGQDWTEINVGTRASIATSMKLKDERILIASQEGELMVSSDGGRTFDAARSTTSLPITGLVEASEKLVATTLRGIRMLDLPKKVR